MDAHSILACSPNLSRRYTCNLTIGYVFQTIRYRGQKKFNILFECDFVLHYVIFLHDVIYEHYEIPITRVALSSLQVQYCVTYVTQ